MKRERKRKRGGVPGVVLAAGVAADNNSGVVGGIVPGSMPVVVEGNLGSVATTIPAESPEMVRREVEFKRIAADVALQHVVMGERYLRLCQFIRSEGISPVCVTRWLLDLGFNKSRASEVKRVAFAPDAAWEKFSAREIGWKGALQMTRNAALEVRAALEQPNLLPPVEDKFLTAGALEGVRELEEKLVHAEEEKKQGEAEGAAMSDADKKREKKRAALAALKKCLGKCLALAEICKPAKPMSADIGGGWQVVLHKSLATVKTSPDWEAAKAAGGIKTEEPINPGASPVE